MENRKIRCLLCHTEATPWKEALWLLLIIFIYLFLRFCFCLLPQTEKKFDIIPRGTFSYLPPWRKHLSLRPNEWEIWCTQTLWWRSCLKIFRLEFLLVLCYLPLKEINFLAQRLSGTVTTFLDQTILLLLLISLLSLWLFLCLRMKFTTIANDKKKTSTSISFPIILK